MSGDCRNITEQKCDPFPGRKARMWEALEIQGLGNEPRGSDYFRIADNSPAKLVLLENRLVHLRHQCSKTLFRLERAGLLRCILQFLVNCRYGIRRDEPPATDEAMCHVLSICRTC